MKVCLNCARMNLDSSATCIECGHREFANVLFDCDPGVLMSNNAGSPPLVTEYEKSKLTGTD